MNTTITVVSPHTFYGNLVSLLLLITFTQPPWVSRGAPGVPTLQIRGQLRQRSNELTVKMTNLTSNTRQPLGVVKREGVRCTTKGGEEKAKRGVD